jgi:hypothetical protein
MIKNKFIKSLGVELEGGIDNADLKKIRNYVNERNLNDFYSESEDGSVYVEGFQNSGFEIKFWNKKISEVKKFTRFCFSNGLAQNESCGNHIHIRIDEELIPLLELPSFYYSFIKEYKKEFYYDYKYLDRLSNRYCPAYNLTNKIIKQIERDGYSFRYAPINFLSLSESQKTIEFRIFPYVEDYEEYANMLDWFIEVVNKLIKKQLNNKVFSKNLVFNSVLLNETVNYYVFNFKNAYFKTIKGHYKIK